MNSICLHTRLKIQSQMYIAFNTKCNYGQVQTTFKDKFEKLNLIFSNFAYFTKKKVNFNPSNMIQVHHAVNTE